tara:strand:+ start:469 stop:921 length:453 start_codon:yes stop_codon:yes gene_type:complete
MKTSKNYSPKVSIEIEKLEALLKTCTNAINHSVQTEVFINHNPHVHAGELRKALKTIEAELKEQKKQWICPYARVENLTEELDELNQEDKDRYEPNQEFSYLHDTIDEYVSEAEKCFNYEPTDEELSDSYGFTAQERADQAWQRKIEAKS